MSIRQTKKGRFRIYDKEGKHVSTKDTKDEADIEMAKVNPPPTSEHDDEAPGEDGETDSAGVDGEGKAKGESWDAFFRNLRRGR